LLHATVYCAIPAGLDAIRSAHEVLVAEGALRTASRNNDQAQHRCSNSGLGAIGHLEFEWFQA
jgi:hypothetical protein